MLWTISGSTRMERARIAYAGGKQETCWRTLRASFGWLSIIRQPTA
jgi:hypothetical protein